MLDPPEREAPLSASILADAAERGGDRYDSLGKRLGRYAVAHERALAMRDYISRTVRQDVQSRRVAHELHHCGTYLVFRHYLESDRVRLHGLRSCRQHIICPLCAIRRGAKMLARYLERMQIVLERKPNLEAHMVTLTVKNRADLGEAFAHLHRSVRRLHKRRVNATRHADSQMHRVRGAVWSYEFKRGDGSGWWHPHVHAVWLCERGNGPSQASLSREWLEITGDSHVVETHALYGELVDAFAEVFKYAVKFAGLELPDNWHAFATLRGRRMVASSGLLWGVEVPEDLSDELLDEARWVDLFFRFMRGQGYVSRGIAHTDSDQAA